MCRIDPSSRQIGARQIHARRRDAQLVGVIIITKRSMRLGKLGRVLVVVVYVMVMLTIGITIRLRLAMMVAVSFYVQRPGVMIGVSFYIQRQFVRCAHGVASM